MKKNLTFALVTLVTFLFSFFAAPVLVNAQTVQGIGYSPSPDTVRIFPTVIDAQYPLTIEWSVMPKDGVIPIKWGTVQLNSAQEGFPIYGLEASTTYKLGTTVNRYDNGYSTSTFATEAATGISKALSDATTINLHGKTLYVTVPDEYLGKTVTVYNMLGQAMLTEKIKDTTQRIDLQELSAGAYLISLETGDGKVTKKVNLGS
jgi:hypothetical protein